MKKLDATDIKIINILQGNSRTTASDIADAIDMSVPAVSERIKKLETSGVIEKYTLVLDKKKLGKPLTALMFVSITNNIENGDEFDDFIKNEGDILECHCVTGEFDYQLKISTTDTTELERIFLRIKSFKFVNTTSTFIVLSSIKNSQSIEL